MFKKLFVTGGCGFIGSNFIRHILNKYPEMSVVNIDKLAYNQKNDNLVEFEKDKRYSFHKKDICDSNAVDKLMSDCDAIVHFAAESHVDRSIVDSTPFVKTNVLGTQVLLDSAVKNKLELFYHISTDEVFGELDEEGKFSEDTPYDPRSPYSASKASSDHLVRSYYHTHNLPIVVSNCSNNYGPYQYPEKVIPLFITNLIQGKKVPLYGKGSNVRDWLHVFDHCDAIELILKKGRIGETYCIGGDTELSNLELTRLILKEMNFDDDMIDLVKDRKGHDFRYSIDFSKIKKELGWEPKIPFKKGIKDTIRWYKENDSWWKNKISSI